MAFTIWVQCCSLGHHRLLCTASTAWRSACQQLVLWRPGPCILYIIQRLQRYCSRTCLAAALQLY